MEIPPILNPLSFEAFRQTVYAEFNRFRRIEMPDAFLPPDTFASVDGNGASYDPPCPCYSCRSRRRRGCATCGQLDGAMFTAHDTGRMFCQHCVYVYAPYDCVECGEVSESRFPCDSGYCPTCCGCGASEDYDEYDEYDETPRSGLVRDYGYRPLPIFHGEGTVHLGMELEVEVPGHRLQEAAECATGHLGELGYLKEDGSISCGFEIVTHPMTHAYAAESFPWEMLSDLEECGAHGGDEVGIHVHVSRAGFSGPAHVYRWLKLIYRNADAIIAIARRESDVWAPFSRQDRSRVKDYAKGDRIGRRYAAVNVTNYATFEVRVFASTLNPRQVRAALDLVAGSVEYTRNLTVREINNGGWTWDNFIDWADEQGDTYAALVEESEELV